MSEEKESKFEIWWNSPKVKQVVGAVYSLGAAVVIIGAMFKILHLPGAALMLGIGMSVEAVLFSLGVLDKPHPEYHWEQVFDFNGEPVNGVALSKSNGDALSTNGGGDVVSTRVIGLDYTESISDEDVKKLSEGIKNLTETAQQFATLSNVVGSTEKFVKVIDGASLATGKFVENQELLNETTGLLTTSYKGITEEMQTVEKNTKLYGVKVEDINKNLASINSTYEVQLKNIQSQSESLTQQTERVRLVNNELDVIVSDIQKMKTATLTAAAETEKFKTGTVNLAKQVADLNQVYGNMLNALS